MLQCFEHLVGTCEVLVVHKLLCCYQFLIESLVEGAVTVTSVWIPIPFFLFGFLAEAENAEKQALQHFEHLVSSCCEVLAFLKLLCYHQFHNVTATLPQVANINNT